MKKMLLIGLGASALLMSLGAWHWLQNDMSDSTIAPMPFPDKSATQQSMSSTLNAREEHAEHAHGSGLHASPFELAHLSHEALAQGAKQVPSQPQNMAALPEQEVTSPAEAERTKKLQELGYMLPPEYYSKDLKTLRRMAKAGDAFAMMHIGEN